MRATGSIIAWLIATIFLWGGCAAPTLLRSSPPVPEETARSSRTRDTLRDDRDSEQPRIVGAEAALVRETALAKGFSPVVAGQFEQAILNAPAQDRSFLIALAFAQLNGSSPNRSVPESPPRQGTAGHRPPSPDSGHLVPPTISDRQRIVDGDSTSDPVAEGPVTDGGEAAAVRSGNQEGMTDAASAAVAPPAATHDRDLASADPLSINMQSQGPTAGDPEAGPAKRESRVDPSEPPRSSTRGDGGRAQQASGTSADSGASLAVESVPDPANESWQKQLRHAIARLQRDLDGNTLDEIDAARLRACLSLLQLAADDPEKAMATLEGMDEQQLEFWRQTVWGLGVLLNPEELPKFRQRVEEATKHLGEGLSTLSTLGPLRLVNLAFCTKVLGYGDFVECDAYSLAPGREVLLYVEVENFTVEVTESGGGDVGSQWSTRRNASSSARHPIYETELHGHYKILDGHREVVERAFPPNRDRSRNRRRDYFIPYSLQLPKNIAPGSYTLELTVEDKIGNKFGIAVVDFRVR